MGKTTKIQYCDSTVNVTPVCDGCELWRRDEGGPCFAGNYIRRFEGKKGWPDRFEKWGYNSYYPERLTDAGKWSDLTGTERSDKPWLNGRPRVVFLNDMGDFASHIIPLEVQMDILTEIDKHPHQYMIFTKRAKHLAHIFNEFGEIPHNVIPVISVTGDNTAARAKIFINELRVQGESPLGISFEPLMSEISYVGDIIDDYDWIAIGGMSDQGQHKAVPFQLAWVPPMVKAARARGIKVFFKQTGSHVLSKGGERYWMRTKHGSDIENVPLDKEYKPRELWYV